MVLFNQLPEKLRRAVRNFWTANLQSGFETEYCTCEYEIRMLINNVVG
jgi:hypothetical protein